MPAYMLLAVTEATDGDVEVETAEGATIVAPVKIVELRATNTETLENEDVTLVIPGHVGPAFLSALLTEDQFDAAVNA